MPPASPAATMFVNSGSNVFGCLRIASASEAPASTSLRVCRITAEKFLSSSCVAEDIEALHERQSGVDHHRELAREHRQVLRWRPLAGALLAFGQLGGWPPAAIRVTRICSRRSAATAASIVSATRSPLTVCPRASVPNKQRSA